MNRALVAIGSLCGGAGISLSAAAAHLGGGNVGTAATMLLAHAPLIVAAGLYGVKRFGLWSVGLLTAGLLLFCSDLVWRTFFGDRLFVMAAPMGGAAMIAGWLSIAGWACFKRRDADPI